VIDEHKELLAKLAVAMESPEFRARVASLINKPRMKKPLTPRSVWLEGSFVNGGPRCTFALTAKESFKPAKLWIKEDPVGSVEVVRVWSNHGGKDTVFIDKPFSVEAMNADLFRGLRNGPYFGRLDPGERLFFEVKCKDGLREVNIIVAGYAAKEGK
jgi:hypothetical protein